jgi:tyrosyl-tRNA synthetase
MVETGLCSSKGAARKDVTAGGVYVNNERVTDPAAVISQKDLIAGGYVVLRKGKKNYHLVTLKA